MAAWQCDSCSGLCVACAAACCRVVCGADAAQRRAHSPPCPLFHTARTHSHINTITLYIHSLFVKDTFNGVMATPHRRTVIAIDPAELSPEVASHPSVHHLRLLSQVRAPAAFLASCTGVLCRAMCALTWRPPHLPPSAGPIHHPLRDGHPRRRPG